MESPPSLRTAAQGFAAGLLVVLALLLADVGAALRTYDGTCTTLDWPGLTGAEATPCGRLAFLTDDPRSPFWIVPPSQRAVAITLPLLGAAVALARRRHGQSQRRTRAL